MKDMVLYISQREMQVARLGVVFVSRTSFVKSTLHATWKRLPIGAVKTVLSAYGHVGSGFGRVAGVVKGGPPPPPVPVPLPPPPPPGPRVVELVGLFGICVYVTEFPFLSVVVTITSPLRVVLPPPMTSPGAGHIPATPQLVIVVVANMVVVPVPGRGVHVAREIGVNVRNVDGEIVLPPPLSGAGPLVQPAMIVGVRAQVKHMQASPVSLTGTLPVGVGTIDET